MVHNNQQRGDNMKLIKNGIVYTMKMPPIPGGRVVIDGERIAGVYSPDERLPGDESKMEIIDAEGGWIMPGLIDAHCHVGILEDSVGEVGRDANEGSDPITPYLSAVDGVNPMDPAFSDAVKAGITSIMTGPGSSNVVGGQFVFLKTSGISVDDMIVKAPAAMKVAFGENPKDNFGKNNQSPVTRMAIAGMLREEISRAREYQREKMFCRKEEGYFREDYRYECWLPVLEKRIPIKAHAHRADDILTAIRIAQEFDLELTLDHCTEGHLIADKIKASGYPVNLGPALQWRNKCELKELSLQTPAIMERYGMNVALITDHPVSPIYMLPIYAGISVREGLSLEAALQAITVNAAKVCGVSDRVGTLARGMDADIAVYSDNPLSNLTQTLYTIINGKIVYSRDKNGNYS